MMPRRVGASSSRQGLPGGMRSVRSNLQDRSRQRDLTKNPWSPEARKNPASQKATGIENMLRYALLRKGINFIEQASIGPWSIDFLLPDYMACVEADGEFWHSSVSVRMKDRRKDAWLKSRGYIVFHFDGWEIKQDSDYCVARMMKSLENRVENLVKSYSDSENEEENVEELFDEEPDGDGNEPEAPQGADDEYERWLSGGKGFSP
jgi:very-short-patch-repair endonuclease